jgi:hypothetical protein
LRPKKPVKIGAIRQISHYQVSVFRNGLAIAPTQVIEDDYRVSGL